MTLYLSNLCCSGSDEWTSRYDHDKVKSAHSLMSRSKSNRHISRTNKEFWPITNTAMGYNWCVKAPVDNGRPTYNTVLAQHPSITFLTPKLLNISALGSMVYNIQYSLTSLSSFQWGAWRSASWRIPIHATDACRQVKPSGWLYVPSSIRLNCI